MNSEQTSSANWTILFLAWLMACIATLGSLFFSEVMEFPPCALCWYQRILMYPLVIVFAMGLFPFDKSVIRYSLPLAATGWIIALYHNLLHYGIIPESLQPCRQGVSCSEVYIELLGFLTIPMLSLISFSVIIVLLVTLKRRLAK